MSLETRLGRGAEFDLIRRFLGRDAVELPSHVRVGPGDDAAVIDAGPIAISCDLCVEDVHFRRAWLEPQEIGYRAAAAALSDLAAMAARPVAVLLGLAVAAADVPDTAEAIVDGARHAAQDARAALVGGDVTLGPDRLVLDAVVLGALTRALRRRGATAGDEVWLTGRIGGAAAAVRAWLDGGTPRAAARERFARPRPRTEEARWLAEHAELRAGIDLSDGLAGDAGHLAAASGVRIVLEQDALPVDDAAGASLDDALHGGEDYELCLVAGPGALQPHVAAFRERFGIDLTRVGRVAQPQAMPDEDTKREGGVWLVGAHGDARPLERGGYSHFADVLRQREAGGAGEADGGSRSHETGAYGRRGQAT